MSSQHVDAVYANSKARGLTLSVLLAMAHLADERGEVAIPTKKLGEVARRHQIQVFQAQKRLKELGEIVLVAYEQNGICRYRINLDQASAREEAA